MIADGIEVKNLGGGKGMGGEELYKGNRKGGGRVEEGKSNYSKSRKRRITSVF